MCAETELIRSKGFSQVYRKYFPVAVSMVGVLDNNCSCAEDIVQDIFMNLWKGDKWQRVDCLRNYLFLSIRNRLVSEARKKKIFLSYDTLALELTDPASADDRIHVKATAELIEKTLHTLSPRRREVFHLSRIEQLTHRQIAQQLGIAPITVSEYIMIACGSLKEALHRQCA